MIQCRHVFLITLGVLMIVDSSEAGEASCSFPDQVMDRYRSLLCSRKPPPIETVRKYANQLSPSGEWVDIDYADDSRAGWQPNVHLKRIRSMALSLATRKDTPRDEAKLRRAIELALDHWGAKRYQSPASWWWNRIGVPRDMRDIVALLGDDLKGERRAGAIEVIGQHKVNGTGANLMWSAELSLHHGCLTGNREQIARATERIWAEVKVNAGDGDGIQRDGSFTQHGARLQMFHYGKAYLGVVCEIAWQLRETPWSIPEDKRAIISNYILDGPRWMCRGTSTVPGALDRAVSRKGSLQGADLRRLSLLWREVDPEHGEEFDAFITRQEEGGTPLVGYRHFALSDFTAYHRPAGSVFLKTVSTRTLFTESINNENQKGVPYLSCGDHYVLRDGLEYHDLQPVWQWRYLPGLTTSPEDLTQEREDFVGGVGNGRSGLTVMDYERGGGDGAGVSVHKAWFFHDDVIICLMGYLKSVNVPGPVVSSLEQCRSRGAVTVRNNESEAMELKPGNHDLDGAVWLLHNGIGYIPLNMDGVKVFLGEREGSWHSINHQYAQNDAREPVFQILLKHGSEPKSQGWVIVLDATSQKLDAIVKKPDWKILRNDRDCQAIRCDDGFHMASFHGPDSTGGDAGVTVDQPCVAMWSEDQLWICDPTMKGRDVELSWRGRTFSVELPEGGDVERVAFEANSP